MSIALHSEAQSGGSSARSRNEYAINTTRCKRSLLQTSVPVNISIMSSQEQIEAEAPLGRHKRAAETVRSLMNVGRQFPAEIFIAKDLNDTCFAQHYKRDLAAFNKRSTNFLPEFSFKFFCSSLT